ncbi:exodeoxyribonuclease VII large subunit [Corynebacterium sp. HS2168-gen11]|uniref:exodeoxyribonuclease VII large subunit n=1 Tax=Corynebacterium sp. HS2168-gen11 TaxID=2974027 RepID=UPI00216B3B5A|nr:exodeoxyribonuclease VII large subunit [Corynebacterium sp. HS2168-gen11]MCS4534962.1 exodeoxyribonuclease VII large subunit [Corynebacterium sp. HS2168-gen11]
MAAKNTPETAFPVREFNKQVKGWIDRLGNIWVEGQVAQVQTKPNWQLAYITLRDVAEENSLSVTCSSALAKGLEAGARVVVLGKPSFYEGRGSFSLAVTEIQHVGLGALLERIAKLRMQLQTEGLFDPKHKRPLPFLPRTIGLITGRGSAAERDVLSVAQRRWPEVQFRVENTAVQGPRAVPEIIRALEILDADPNVDVIIIARGGGSVEDLLPFSEESLQRAVFAAHTPVVSAIGHEPDNPILDNTADLRAATPTDAAKMVVPDVLAEKRLLAELRHRGAQALQGWVQREQQGLRNAKQRPALANPLLQVERYAEELDRHRTALRRSLELLITTQHTKITALRQQVAALGPAATLARGYAVMQVIPRDGSEPEVVMDVEQAPPGSQLRIRVAGGSVTAVSMSTQSS